MSGRSLDARWFIGDRRARRKHDLRDIVGAQAPDGHALSGSKDLLVAVLPALLAMATFANTLWNGLVYDDRWTSQRLQTLLHEPVGNVLVAGRGLTYAVHLMDAALWGPWQVGFHLTNILLHSFASALAAIVGLAVTRSRRAALLCGLLFAVHPVHVETVALFSYRKDLLAMIFICLALLLWLGSHRSTARYVGALLCYGLALLSKEVTAVGLAGMFVLADLLLWRRESCRKSLRTALLRSTPVLVLTVAAIVVVAWNGHGRAMRDIRFESNDRIRTYGQVLATSLGSVPDAGLLLALPVTLSADYPIRPQPGLFAPRVILGAALLTACGLFSLTRIRRAPAASFAAAWMLVMYLPSSNVVPLTHFFVQERYLYVPSFGACLLAGIALASSETRAGRSRHGRARLVRPLLALLLVAAGSVRSIIRNRDWRDAYSLWSSSLAAGIETPRIHHGLATEYVRRGNPQLAVNHYRRAAELLPYTGSQLRLAKALLLAGRLDEAQRLCRWILGREPQNEEARWVSDVIAQEMKGAARPAIRSVDTQKNMEQ